jgi:hypothetical protein
LLQANPSSPISKNTILLSPARQNAKLKINKTTAGTCAGQKRCKNVPGLGRVVPFMGIQDVDRQTAGSETGQT